MPLRSIPRRLAALPLLALIAAVPAAAQAPAGDPAHAAGGAPQWSHGVYAHHLGAAKRWAVGGRTWVEDEDIGRFIAKIGGDSADVPGRRDPEEVWNAAVLAVLGRQGWELVGCEVVGRQHRESYFCYLRKPIAPAAP